MRRSGVNRKFFWAMLCVMAMLLSLSAGSAMASSEGSAQGAGPVEGAVSEAQGHAQDAHEAAEGGGHATETKHWEITDTYKTMNFVVLVAGLFFLLKKPATQALSARILGIKEQLAELEKKKEEAELLLAEHNERISRLGEEADKILEESMKQGEEAKARILKEAAAAAERLEEQAKRSVAYEFKQARQRLREEVLEQALAEAEKLIIKKIKPQDQERLVDEFLEKVVA
ncbi:MAG: F0F1 ATP synthase subunit B [Desulfobacterales bacterium]|jgi:F-type H+-transporting ATPase subunit b|nr:F0F1 ATP synthase subunit B [Desulfobacterales bacterium]MDY0377059.1 F0F1 ATP synthase subunit B [Desulfobacterales bacterium]